MKAPTLISTAALMGSVFAIVLAGRQPKSPSQSDIDAMVDARLTARELELVQEFEPKFRVMYDEMGESELGAKWSPRTLKELLEPLVKTITSMGELPPPEPATEQVVPPNGP